MDSKTKTMLLSLISAGAAGLIARYIYNKCAAAPRVKSSGILHIHQNHIVFLLNIAKDFTSGDLYEAFNTALAYALVHFKQNPAIPDALYRPDFVPPVEDDHLADFPVTFSPDVQAAMDEHILHYEIPGGYDYFVQVALSFVMAQTDESQDRLDFIFDCTGKM